MGYEGYINSDTGIVHNMDWGVEMLDEPERIGYAVNHAGVDLISTDGKPMTEGRMIIMKIILCRKDLRGKRLY